MTKYPEEIHEDDGDELGGLMGWHLDGHVDLAAVEAFMVSEDVEEAFDGVHRYAPRGFDVEHTYVRKVPAEYGWRYQYARSPGRGLHPVTRIQANVDWEHWCINHPDEIAAVGIDARRVADAEPLPGEQHVYVCGTCWTRFSEREATAREAALAHR